jgi:two-component system, NtrC family, response regulator AtoC
MLQRPNQVLVIDDDEAAREILVELLGRIGYHAFATADGKAGLEWLAGAAAPPQAVLLDLRMPVLDGFEVLRRYRAEGGNAPVIALSAMDEKEAVVKAMRLGASDYLVKPIEPEELKEAIQRCGVSRPPTLEEPQAAPIIPAVRPSEPPPVVAQLRVEPGRRGVPTEYVASSPAMLSIWDMVDRVAETDVPVLIRGESGVGKEGIARTLHERSPRRGKPFVKINCAALPSELLESELFGHERGAFTGATSEKPGKFELADKGTIFLDEIGEMHPALQAKLLQVLQDEEYYRVGGKRALRADARVVVATNRVLEDEIARGNFREDLYYRLNVIEIHIPALRERTGDIPLLAHHFLHQYATANKKDVRDFSDDVLAMLLRHNWPGNVRELQNAMERAVVLATEPVLAPAQFPTLRRAEMAATAGPGADRKSNGPAIPGSTLAEIEREAIIRTLEAVDGSTSRAAELLQISARKIQYKLKEYHRERAVVARDRDAVPHAPATHD